jgi:hypothetical protein
MSWISQILQETSEFECPERYIYWACLTAISAVCRKNFYLDRFAYKCYPNVYVLLVGDSGLKKGYAVKLAKDLATKAHSTRVIAGRYSIPAAIRELGKAFHITKTDMLKEAHGFLCNSELDAAFVKDDDSFSVLTDLYDCHWNPKWDNWLKGGDVNLDDPYIVILGGSNETNLKDALPNKAIGGGYIARSIVVFEEKPRTISSLVYPPEIQPNIEKYANRLREISNMRGEFKFTDSSGKFFDSWYQEFKRGTPKDRTGTLMRIDETILKVAMLLSLSERFDLLLIEEDLQEAIDSVLLCYDGMRRVFLGSGKAELAEKTGIILKHLMKQSDLRMTRTRLINEGWKWGDYDSTDVDKIMDTLQQSGALLVHREGGDVIYELRREIAEQYIKFKSEMN